MNQLWNGREPDMWIESGSQLDDYDVEAIEHLAFWADQCGDDGTGATLIALWLKPGRNMQNIVRLDVIRAILDRQHALA